MSERLRILLIEDNPGDADLIRELLTEEDMAVSIECTSRLATALERVRQDRFDVILLDLGLPDSSGLGTLLAMRQQAADVPIVVLTGNNDERMGLAAIQDGAQDYFVKGQVRGNMLMHAVQYAIERKRAEEKLKRQNILLNAIINSAKDTIIIALDKNYRYLAFNENHRLEMKKVYNTDIEIGQCMLDYISIPEIKTLVKISYDRVLNGESFTEIQWQPNIDIWYEFNWSPIRTAEGEIIGINVFISDITKRKRAEEVLRLQSEILQNMSEGVQLTRASDEVIVFTNPRFEVMFGYQNGELLGKNVNILNSHGSETPQEIVNKIRNSLLQTNVWNGEVFNVRKDGSTFWCHANVTTFNHPEHGKTWISVHVDITERKQAEEALASEKERLAVTLRSIGDGVITTDIAGKVVIMNKVAENLTGWSQNEAQGKPFATVFNIINEISLKTCENPVEKVITTGNIIELANHTLLISRDGTKHVIADSGAPIKDKNSVTIGVVLVFRDMTEKQKLLDNMQRIDKLDSLGILAGGIAHDFNNLLGGIFGYIEMARKDSTDEQISRYLDKSMSVFTRAKDLTQQLLTFSKGGEPLRKIGSLGIIIKDSTSFTLSGSKVTCCYDIAGGLWLCDFDENQIGQVINNILINAQQAMPLGGTIEISAKNIFLNKDEPIPIKSGKYVKISIADTGIGIPHDLLNRIFDPFFTTKQKGNGLGLATCYSIIQKHGGWMEVESEQAKGTTFHIWLPASDKEIVNISESEIELHKGIGTILIMDDEAFMRELTGELLQEMGYETIEAKDGEEALKILADAKTNDQPIIGAILDLTIPGGIGGKEMVGQIRKMYPGIHVFASSGYSEDPVICRPTHFGFTDSIQKPYRISDMAAMLNRHLKDY